MGGGRSHRLLKVEPRKEKNRDEERKEPVGDVKPGPLPLVKINTIVEIIPCGLNIASDAFFFCSVVKGISKSLYAT